MSVLIVVFFACRFILRGVHIRVGGLTHELFFGGTENVQSRLQL